MVAQDLQDTLCIFICWILFDVGVKDVRQPAGPLFCERARSRDLADTIVRIPDLQKKAAKNGQQRRSGERPHALNILVQTRTTMSAADTTAAAGMQSPKQAPAIGFKDPLTTAPKRHLLCFKQSSVAPRQGKCQ
jgi:hypothetical protein